jgi:hypothetical protein
MLDSAEVATRCRQFAGRCDGNASLEDACEQLEELHRRRKFLSQSGGHQNDGQYSAASRTCTNIAPTIAIDPPSA